jgi:protein involved in polysaccharide export with SLBB domain
MQLALAFRRLRSRIGRQVQSLLGVASLVCAAVSGCAAVTNPLADAVPVRKLPPEIMGQRKEEERTIPLPLLRQRQQEVYRLAPGDTLGVLIDTVLGDEKQQPPPVVHFAEAASLPPAVGYPVTVGPDGAIRLPLVEPVPVNGLSVDEAREEIIRAYTVTKKVLTPDRARVVVTLMRPRLYHVLVVRQDTGAIPIGGTGGGGATSGPLITGLTGPAAGAAGLIGQTKRGTGYVVDLPAYENDVLNALARTGGLPGLDAQNEVVIERGTYEDFADPLALAHRLEQPCPPDSPGIRGAGANWVRIPLRLRPGEPLPFRPEDVVLRSGDIVFIEARDTQVFYTGGLLPSRQFQLPRDYDLDVVQAIALANGPLLNGAQNVNNLSGNLVQSGLGFESPSLVTVLRRTPGGGQIPIRVDLNRALRDPRERVLIQPGDILLLQETPLESVVRYVGNVLRLDFLGTFIRQRDLTGTATLTVPGAPSIP